MTRQTSQHQKVGAWLIGARGSISATVMIGAFALRRNLIPTTGMVTASPAFDDLDLLPAQDLVFGGCDIRRESMVDSARRALGEGLALDQASFAAITDDLMAVDANVCVGTARNCGAMIENLAEEKSPETRTPSEELREIRGQLQAFRDRSRLDSVVVINLASTEPPLTPHPCHHQADAFEQSFHTPGFNAVQASTLYAYAAILEGCPYINFTPSNGALIPALIELAVRKKVPVMGSDGKTGETLVKSALAPMFLSRNLEILSWEGVNMLGNLDGKVLNDPQNCASKLESKDQVLHRIMGYSPHSRVHIHYVPSLSDQKTAWDFIHFQGFLGAKMSLQFTWQGYDSALAAPLVLDLLRLAEFAQRHGEGGLMPQLASFFKSPMAVEEYRHGAQYEMLLRYAAEHRKGA